MSASGKRRPLFKPVRGVLVAGLIGALAFTCGVALTATSGWLIVRASERPVVLTLLTAIVCVRAFGIGRPVFRYAERLISHNAALGDLTQRRTAAYRQLLPLTPARLGTRRRSDLLSGVVRDLDDEVDVQVRVIVPLLTTLGAALTVVVVTLAIHPPAGLVVLGCVLASAVVGWIDLSLERRGQADLLAARGDVDRVAHLVASSTTELAAIGAASKSVSWLRSAQEGVERAAARQARGRALGVGLALVVTGVSTLAMAWTLDGEVRAGAIDGPFAALLLLTPLALGDVVGLIPDAVGSLARSGAARDRLQNLFDQQPAVRDNGLQALSPAQAPHLELVSLTASWNGVKRDLGILDLAISPGEHVALTGRNGCGKSTVLAVLARHLDPTSGRYEIDGVDVCDLKLADVRRLFAVVDDDPHVFAGTLRANLLLAHPDAEDADIITALRLAGLSEWFDSLDDGLDTDLGEHSSAHPDGDVASTPDATQSPLVGVAERSISGGERARLGVARALLSGRPVVLLDEPVAHLDGPTADAVIRDLMKASTGRTVVMVSHSPVAFDALDRVIDLPSILHSDGPR